MSMFLREHPEEQRTVGYILTRYGDAEYQWAACAGEAINDKEVGIRSLFRLRGGSVRIQVGDAIMRPAMDKIGLKDAYDASLGAFRYSTQIRNQYAHCHWFNSGEKNGLYFSDLQKAATTSVGPLYYTLRHVDMKLLQAQSRYLDYTTDWLFFLVKEYLKKVGRSPIHDELAPKIIEQPPLHNPIEEHPLPKRFLNDQQPQEGPLQKEAGQS